MSLLSLPPEILHQLMKTFRPSLKDDESKAHLEVEAYQPLLGLARAHSFLKDSAQEELWHTVIVRSEPRLNMLLRTLIDQPRFVNYAAKTVAIYVGLDAHAGPDVPKGVVIASCATSSQLISIQEH
jgi:hypothetical protein